MKLSLQIFYGALLSVMLILSFPALGESKLVLGGQNTIAIVRVFGAPVAIHGSFSAKRKRCLAFVSGLEKDVHYLQSGQSLEIMVVGDKNIVLTCNGTSGVEVSRK